MPTLISDDEILDQVRRTWGTVRVVQASVRANLNAGMTGVIGGVPLTMDFFNLSHSLVLLFAFSVLEDVLDQARDEGKFSCRKNNLGALMSTSQDALDWVDFKTVDKGRECRNHLAHDQVIPPRADSWKFIDAIEAELVSWGILDGPVTAECTISVTRFS